VLITPMSEARGKLHGGPRGAEVRPVAINFQLVIDCTDPKRLARFLDGCFCAALYHLLTLP
jgi:hypothetical protein